MTDTYRIGSLELLPRRQLLSNGDPIAIGRKALDLLSVLAEAKGALVTKDELMEAVWPGLIIEENGIQVHVAALRKAMGEDGGLLTTVRGLGYRLSLTDTIRTDLKLPAEPSIAVLPFTDMTGGDDDSHFADGMVEEISTALSRFKSLFVIAGQSSLTFRDADRDMARISRELGVRYLLEGSVRRAGGRVRITLKLLDAIDGEQIWADKFEDNLDDVFELQDRVANEVASLIDTTIETAELRRAVNRPTNTPSANELYWRANALFRIWDRPSVESAIELTNQVRDLDPDNTWAIALAGFCHASLFSNGWTDDIMASRTSALACYEKAMAHNATDPRVAGYAVATLVSVGGDTKVADRLIQKSLALNPGSSLNLFWGGWLDIIIGEPERAMVRFENAIRLNPRWTVRPFVTAGIGISHFQLGRFDDATVLLGEAVQQLPQYPAALAALAASLAHCGRTEEAAKIAQRLVPFGGAMGILVLLEKPQHRQSLESGLALAQKMMVTA